MGVGWLAHVATTVAKVRGRATMFLSQVRTMLPVSRPTVFIAATLGLVVALPVAALSDPQIDGPATAVQPAGSTNTYDFPQTKPENPNASSLVHGTVAKFSKQVFGKIL